MGSKKKTTNVDTGLGDSQYKILSGNQANIAGTLDQQGLEAQAANKTITDGLTGLSADSGNILTNTQGLSTGQTSILDAIRAQPDVDLSGVEGKIDGLGTSMMGDDGFGGVSTRFDTVDDTLKTGFDGVSGRFDTVDAGINEMIGADGTIQTGFQGVQDTLSPLVGEDGSIATGFRDAGTERQGFYDTTKEDNRVAREEQLKTLLGEEGFAGLVKLISDNEKAAVLARTGLSDNQTTMMDNQQAGFGTLDAFKDRYETDIPSLFTKIRDVGDTAAGVGDLVNDRTGKLAQSMSTAITGINNNNSRLGDIDSNVGRDLSSIGTGIGDLGKSVAGINTTDQTDYAKIAGSVADNVSGLATGQELTAEGQKFASTMGEIRNVITSQGQNMDANIRNSYTNLSNSFDENGKLIETSIDANGVETARAIDDQGNLLISAFDSTGKRIGQTALDINALMNSFDTFKRYNVGSNYSMGNPSPAMNSGLMSGVPFTQTTG